MSNKTNLGLVEHVKAILPLNTVYMLSGIGRPLTQDAINRRIQMGDASAKRKKEYLESKKGAFCYDCVGLIKNYLWSDKPGTNNINYNTPVGTDQNVSMMWNSAKKRGHGEHPDVPGILVMTDDLGHVGVYIGKENGKKAYIEATITNNAWKVVKSYGYPGQKHDWKRWAEYHMINYVSAVAPKPVVPKPTPVAPTGNIQVGSAVKVNGKLFTSSSGGKQGSYNHVNYPSTIGKVVAGAKYPYHVSGRGWANAAMLGVTESQPSKPAPSAPSVPSKTGYTIEKIAPRQVVLNIDANLWNADSKTKSGFKSIRKYKRGDQFTMHAILHNHDVGMDYYLTQYSYEKKINNGFNVWDADIKGSVAPAPSKPAPAPAPAPAKKSNEAIAAEVKLGRWGNGQDRINRLSQAGYNPTEIQRIVDRGKQAPAPAPKKDFLELLYLPAHPRYGTYAMGVAPVAANISSYITVPKGNVRYEIVGWTNANVAQVIVNGQKRQIYVDKTRARVIKAN